MTLANIRYKDNIKMDLKAIKFPYVNWMLLYIQCTGRLRRLLLSVGKNSAIVISGFRREVDENCVLLGYYGAGGGNSVPTIRDNQPVPSSAVKNHKKPTLEDGTDRMSRNVGKELTLLAA